MLEPVSGFARLDHAINAGLQLAWVSLQGGDLVGTYGFDARVRQYMTPVRGVSSFPRLQRAAAGLDYPINRKQISRSGWPSSMHGSSDGRW